MRNTFTGLLTAALIAIASNGIADENNVTQLITEIQKQDLNTFSQSLHQYLCFPSCLPFFVTSNWLQNGHF
jgi:aspartokinase-like uncharacterized kinase